VIEDLAALLEGDALLRSSCGFDRISFQSSSCLILLPVLFERVDADIAS
jgi:hypothetical protein